MKHYDEEKPDMKTARQIIVGGTICRVQRATFHPGGYWVKVGPHAPEFIGGQSGPRAAAEAVLIRRRR